MPSPPSIGEGRIASTVQPSDAGEGGDVVAHRGMDLRVAHDAFLQVLTSRLELRLDQRDEPAGGRRERERRRQDEPERDEAHIGDDKRGLFGEPRRIERADVGRLDRDDARIGGKPRMQLAASDIDRIDKPRAAFEQRLGESAGRSADIEADAIGDIDRAGVERRRELHAAAGDERMRGRGGERGVAGDFVGGLAYRRAVGADAAGGDRGLRLGAALEQAALDEQPVGAQARGAQARRHDHVHLSHWERSESERSEDSG